MRLVWLHRPWKEKLVYGILEYLYLLCDVSTLKFSLIFPLRG